MVAENPPPDGDDRGPSLPPEPPNNGGHAPRASSPSRRNARTSNKKCNRPPHKNTLALNDIIQDIRVAFQNRQDYLRANSSAMANSPPPVPSFNFRENQTHIATSALPVVTPIQELFDPKFSLGNREMSKPTKISVPNHA